MVRSAAARAGWSETVRKNAVLRVDVLFAGWLAAAIALGLLGAYDTAPGQLPTIQFGILVPVIVGVLAMRLSSTVRGLVQAVPQPWIVGIQFYRVLGAFFLVLFGVGQLPGVFAIPAGVGDTLVGLAAPFVALAYARRPEANRSWVAWWNILGVTDLVVAVTMGFLSQFLFHNPATLVGAFPLVLVPTFGVPLGFLLHVASLMKLRRPNSVPANLSAAHAHL